MEQRRVAPATNGFRRVDRYGYGWTSGESTVKDGPPYRSFELTDPDGHIFTVRDSHMIGPA